MSRGGRSGPAMRDRGSKLPGPKGGPEREEQVTVVTVVMVMEITNMHRRSWSYINIINGVLESRWFENRCGRSWSSDEPLQEPGKTFKDLEDEALAAAMRSYCHLDYLCIKMHHHSKKS